MTKAGLPATKAYQQLRSGLAQAERAIQRASEIEDILPIINKAALLLEVVTRAGLGVPAHNDIIHIQLEAKRKGGELLGKVKERERTDLSQPGTVPEALTSSEANRWRLLRWAIPKPEWDSYWEGIDSKGELARQSHLLLIARRYQAKIGGTPPLPKGTYQIILADPPWPYDFAPADSSRVEQHYPTMTLEQIAALKIPSADDAVLFLWATAPKLREALSVMAAWGFRYKTHAIWDKLRPGMGYWFLGQHELLLVGTTGEFGPPHPTERVPSIIKAEKSEHSAKPEIVYQLIERWWPLTKPARHLELFARSKRKGWEVWGNES